MNSLYFFSPQTERRLEAVTNDRRAHRPQHNVVIASVAVVLVVSVVSMTLRDDFKTP